MFLIKDKVSSLLKNNIIIFFPKIFAQSKVTRFYGTTFE